MPFTRAFTIRRLLTVLLFATVFVQSFLFGSGYYLSSRGSSELVTGDINAATSSAVDSPRAALRPDFVAETQPLETQPLETQPLATQPLETQPLETQPLASNNAPSELPLDSNPPQVEESAPLTYVVQPGDTLSKIWSKYGSPYTGSLSASAALKELGIAGTELRAGETIELEQDLSGEIIVLKKKLRVGKTIELRGSSTNGYAAKVVEIEGVEIERTASGAITSSFASAALSAAVPYDVIDDLVDIFSPRLEFRRNIQPGDRFTVIYSERRTPDGALLEPGVIRAASIESNGVLLSAIRHIGNDGKARFYDERGEQLGNYFLRYPLKFTRISSAFSSSRFHPVLGKHRPHNGVDFAAPTGTPVRAVADGIIDVAGSRGGAGTMISIRHNERYTTAYMHLSRISSGLRQGSRVKRGDVIGAVGMTGLATGPHLHFSLFDRGTYVNPLQASLPQVGETKDRIPQTVLASTLQTLRDCTSSVMMASAAGIDLRS